LPCPGAWIPGVARRTEGARYKPQRPNNQGGEKCQIDCLPMRRKSCPPGAAHCAHVIPRGERESLGWRVAKSFTYTQLEDQITAGDRRSAALLNSLPVATSAFSDNEVIGGKFANIWYEGTDLEQLCVVAVSTGRGLAIFCNHLKLSEMKTNSVQI